MCMCPMYRWRFDELFTDVQYRGVLCVVQVGYGLGEKTVFVSGCFGAQWSVALARGQQFKKRVSWVWGVQSRGLHGGPETRGPGTRPGYLYLYFKWSAGSGSGPNLLLRVPGLFNIVCNTRVDRRTPHPPEISVSQHACNLQFVKLGWEKCEREIRWKKKKHALPQPPETERGRS